MIYVATLFKNSIKNAWDVLMSLDAMKRYQQTENGGVKGIFSHFPLYRKWGCYI
jgi:hypothetical protein